MNKTDRQIADAPGGNWVDAYAPETVRPYMKLARFDRPIGIWLLLWPCWWSLCMAGQAAGQDFPDYKLFIFFAIGSVVMRGAGCTFNDITDRDFDARVERTSLRPLPSGQVSVMQAWGFLAGLMLIGLAVLLQFNVFTIVLGTASLVLVVIYPFMKRITYWPQLFLGLAFNWGALLGWSAVAGGLSLAPAALYTGAIAWTIGYDTIYAHQDKEDDILIGVKSTALKFGEKTRGWVAGLYGFTIFNFSAALLLAGAGLFSWAGLVLFGAHLLWQIRRLDIDDADGCLTLFRSNRDAGALLFVGLALDAFFT